jgi:ABC-2 type transport system ATP-binding protein
MITIIDLKKTYKSVEILNIPHLNVSQFDILGIVGNNGSGKTTLLRILLDLIKPSSGSISINNIENNDNENWRSIIGGYLDEDNLINFLTPEEYFELIIKLRKKQTIILEKYYSIFQDFFCGEILKQKKLIGSFSKGNKQKIGICASIIAETPCLILDEPFSHLDPTSQINLKNILLKIHKENALTILITGHNLFFVEDFCNRVLVINKGKIEADIQDKLSINAAGLQNYFLNSSNI